MYYPDPETHPSLPGDIRKPGRFSGPAGFLNEPVTKCQFTNEPVTFIQWILHLMLSIVKFFAGIINGLAESVPCVLGTFLQFVPGATAVLLKGLELLLCVVS